MKYSLLYIDDEPNNLVVFRNAFFRYYDIHTATSGNQGLDILDQQEIHLVITDQKMPGMTGIEFLELAIKKHPEVVRMVLTAYSDIDVIMKAVNKCGIFQYILKPWDNRQLKITIDNALNRFQLVEEKKVLIKSLEEANRELEARVLERTDELSRKNQELVKLNMVKDKLFSILSHDLKMPTASLNILLDLLISFRDQMDSEKLLDFSRKAKKYVMNVVDLMDNLLNWSMSHTGELTVKDQKVNLHVIFKDLRGVFVYIAEQKSISLDIDSPDVSVAIRCDKSLTSLILRNLISNAIKYSKSGDKITVSATPNGVNCLIKVSDSGVGIDEQVIKDLAAGNIPASTVGTGDEKGMGLGLKLCKEFAVLQHGELQIESSNGRGTEVTLILPKG